MTARVLIKHVSLRQTGTDAVAPGAVPGKIRWAGTDGNTR